MVVILAGCDGTGKSTCFDLLRKDLDANFIKESYTDSVDKKKTRVSFTASKVFDNDLTIYDRATLIDDFVYDPVMLNKESELTQLMNDSFLSHMIGQCLVIYFDCDSDVLSKRLSNRGDDYVTIDQIHKIKNSYHSFFNRLCLEPVVIDTTNLDKFQVVNKVKEVVKNEEFKNSTNSTT